MKLACLMITTTVKDRLSLLKQTVDSIEQLHPEFDQKILSVDIVEGHPYNPEDFGYYSFLGWDVVPGQCSGRRGMANNMLRGLANVDADADLLFYCEDDVIIQRIPSKDSLRELFYGIMPIGAVVYNTHVHDLEHGDKGVKPKLEYINTAHNYFQTTDGEVVLEKGEAIRDEYWLCFPVAIFRAQQFRNLLNHACENCVGTGMEIGMSKAWFALDYDVKPVVIYVQPDVLNHRPLSFQDLHEKSCMRFWNNDESLRHPSVNDRQNTIF